MAKSPSDQSSLGNILLEFGFVTEDQLSQALEDQRRLRGEDLLGKLLVANGACSEEEIRMAMSAQTSMRAANKHKTALAVADLAIARHRRASMIDRRENLIKKGNQLVRSITAESVVVQVPMLAKNGD